MNHFRTGSQPNSHPFEARVEPHDCVWRSTPGHLVIVDTYGSVTEVDGPAWEIWNSIVAGSTLGDVASELAARFDVPTDRVMADISSFVEVLERRGVVRPKVA